MVGREAMIRAVMRGSKGALETWREKDKAAKCGKGRVLAKEWGGNAGVLLLLLLAVGVIVTEVEGVTTKESKSPAHPESPKNCRAGKSPPSPGKHPGVAATWCTKKAFAPRDTPAAPAFTYSPAAHSRGMQVCGW